MRAQKCLTCYSEIRVKSETLALKKLYPLLEIEYLWILVFRLKAIISGTLVYSLFLLLFSE